MNLNNLRNSSALAWLIICLVLLTTSCSSTSGLIGHSTLTNLEDIKHPASKILLLYQHGSQPENVQDPCYPNSAFLPGRVPGVIGRLAGTEIAGYEVLVYALCSKVPARFDDYPESELKVRLRVTEIRNLLKRVQALGVPPRQVFLVGHSAGAWASLLVASESPKQLNSVIGFAPAFAGQKAFRSEVWDRFFEQQRSELLNASTLRALLYAFRKDPYYDLEDLKLLDSIDQLTMVWPDDDQCLRGHRAVFRPCFENVASETIRDYLRQQLQGER